MIIVRCGTVHMLIWFCGVDFFRSVLWHNIIYNLWYFIS